MGEAKRKQSSTAALLAHHKNCVYCGCRADTVDHCPPRCFFIGRAWPETFAYPACSNCNAETRLDEQALAVMVRVKTLQPTHTAEAAEFSRLLKGVCNNRPELIAEWLSESGSARKRSFRRIFGREQGDLLRYGGWGLMRIGPLTEELVQRFMVRLGQSMYYNHVGKLFCGTMFTQHVSLLQLDSAEAYLKAALSIAPMAGSIQRCGKTLEKQFAYRFNVSTDYEIFYALVHFSEQFVFQIVALGSSMTAHIENEDWPPRAIGRRTQIRLASG